MTQETNYWSRFWHQNTSRRRVLATGGAAGIGAAGIALVGCGDDDDDDDDSGSDPTASSGDGDPTEAPASGEPKRGGEVIYDTGASNAQSLDPHTSLNRAFTYWGIFQNKLVSPHRQDVEPIQGELVESWEYADPATITLKVRQGVNWHEGKRPDGRAVTAEDIAFNLNRIAGKLDPERAAQFQRASTLAFLDEAVAVDESTVSVKLTQPNSQFLNGMGDWRNWPVAPEDVEADPNFNDFAALAGTGPFIIDKFDNTTQTGEYIRNENYWADGPYLDKIRQVSLPDTAASQAAFISGQTSFLTAQDPNVRKQVEGDANIVQWPHTGWEYFRLNQDAEAFRDPNVRKAIQLAINYQELLNPNYGEGFYSLMGPLPGGFPGTWTNDDILSTPGWNPDSKEEDIAEALRLMSAAGFEDGGIEFELYPSGFAGPWFENAIRIADQLGKAFPAIKIDIKAETADFFRDLATGNYEATTYGSFPPPSAFSEAALHYRSDGTRNYTKYSNPEVDTLIDNGLAETDAEARNEIIGDLQQLLLDEIFVIPVGQRNGVYAVQKDIRGFDGWSGPGTYEFYDAFYSSASLWIDA